MHAPRVTCLVPTFALLLVTAGSVQAQVTPELIRERTEREWTVKAQKSRREVCGLDL